VDDRKKKPIIGILGGICSGKSAVAAEFARLGCKIVDADKIAHELLNERSVKEEIADDFGEGILDSEGKIDHKKLADIVFNDSKKLSKLNSIVHRPVLERAGRLIEQFSQEPEVRAIVLDMPLLIEVGWDKRCDRLIFVDCEPDLRLARAREIGILSKEELKKRENFQISLDKKVGISDNTIDNNSDFLLLVRQVKKIFSHIVNNG
jgi:dephospho-CoA kinase